jgi:hypothetical protein
VVLRHGHTSRDKLLEVLDPPHDLDTRLEQLRSR